MPHIFATHSHLPFAAGARTPAGWNVGPSRADRATSLLTCPVGDWFVAPHGAQLRQPDAPAVDVAGRTVRLVRRGNVHVYAVWEVAA